MLTLIVEDDLNIAKIQANLLKKLNLDSYIVSNVNDANNFLTNNVVDIMVLDYILQDGTAKDLLERCKKNNIPIPPFILATGMEDVSLAVDMMKKGARDYLIKDEHFTDLFPSVIHRLKTELLNEHKITQAQKKIKSITNMHLQVFESLDEAVCLVDKNLTILLFNNRVANLCEKFGYDSDIMGKKIDQAIPFIPDQLIKNYSIVISHKKNMHFLTEFKIDDIPLIVEFRQIPYYCEQKLQGVITIAKDVTESELVKKEIEEKQLLLEETQKLSKVGGWKYNVLKQKMSWTRETLNIHGLDPNVFFDESDKYIKTSIQCYPDEYKSIIIQKFKDCVEKGIPYDLEVPFVKFSGEQIRIRTIGKAVKENDKIVQIVGNIMDISDIFEVQEKLKKSEHHIRTIIDAIPSMIYVKNREGRILLANQAVADFFNLELKDIIGKLHVDLPQNKDEVEMSLQSDMQVFETGEPVEIIAEYSLNNKNKKYWAHTIKIPYEGNDFNEPVILGFTVDITRLKKIEDTIRKNEKKYRTLVENLPGITYRCLNDNYWTMLYFSDKSKEILGYPASDFIQNNVRSYESIIHPDDKEHVKIRIQKSVENNLNFNMEYRVYCMDGSIKWVWEKGLGIRDSEGNLLYLDGFIMDISDRKRIEAERQKLEEKLRRAQKLETIGTLAGGIAHDFNNMLTPIMGYSDMALTKIQRINPLYDDLQNILQAAKRAKDLVQQILMFSRQIETEHQPLKPHLIVNEAIKLLRPSIPSTIKIKMDLDKESSYINADPAQIHQIIVNLCTNSFHAMEENGGELRISLKDVDIDVITAKAYDNLKAGKYVQLSIQDTGKGMDRLTMDRIFEPFFTTKPVDKGTGMGLSVVHGIIRNHNGEIIVYSEPGQGTVFHMYFPALAKPDIEDSNINTDIECGSGKILVLDDEKFITKMSKRMLEEAGYDVDISNSSMETLDIISEKPNHYQLLITDLTMPELTGINLAKELRKKNITIPILLMTGYGELITENIIKLNKINGIISKPIIYRDFAKTVKNILNNGNSN